MHFGDRQTDKQTNRQTNIDALSRSRCRERRLNNEEEDEEEYEDDEMFMTRSLDVTPNSTEQRI